MPCSRSLKGFLVASSGRSHNVSPSLTRVTTAVKLDARAATGHSAASIANLLGLIAPCSRLAALASAVGRTLGVADDARQPVFQLLGGELLAKAFDHQRQGKRARRRERHRRQLLVAHALERRGKPA